MLRLRASLARSGNQQLVARAMATKAAAPQPPGQEKIPPIDWEAVNVDPSSLLAAMPRPTPLPHETQFVADRRAYQAVMRQVRSMYREEWRRKQEHLRMLKAIEHKQFLEEKKLNDARKARRRAERQARHETRSQTNAERKRLWREHQLRVLNARETVNAARRATLLDELDAKLQHFVQPDNMGEVLSEDRFKRIIKDPFQFYRPPALRHVLTRPEFNFGQLAPVQPDPMAWVEIRDHMRARGYNMPDLVYDYFQLHRSALERTRNSPGALGMRLPKGLSFQQTLDHIVEQLRARGDVPADAQPTFDDLFPFVRDRLHVHGFVLPDEVHAVAAAAGTGAAEVEAEAAEAVQEEEEAAEGGAARGDADARRWWAKTKAERMADEAAEGKRSRVRDWNTGAVFEYEEEDEGIARAESDPVVHSLARLSKAPLLSDKAEVRTISSKRNKAFWQKVKTADQQPTSQAATWLDTAQRMQPSSDGAAASGEPKSFKQILAEARERSSAKEE